MLCNQCKCVLYPAGCLTMLSMLLSIRTYSGQSADAILHSEIVTLLCMSDRTYSQLCEYTPEKSGTNNPPADLKQYLQKVCFLILLIIAYTGFNNADTYD